VSPARARTSSAEIVAAGRDLLEAGGLDGVTMQAIADRVGVRAPSLYKRFPSRGALIAAVAAAALEDLTRQLAPLSRDPDPGAGLRSLAIAFRQFARANPRTYELLFRNLPPDARPPAELNAAAAAPILEVAKRLVGADRALEAARLVTAFAHGFVSMELSGAFRLGGDVDAAYAYGVDVLVSALAARTRSIGHPVRASSRARPAG
jgi:AcrR family transcriptional regulator